MVPWWLWVAAAAVVAVTAWAFTTRTPDTEDSCAECGHESGLDESGKHCGNSDAYSGWGRDACHCQNDYHWNVESVQAG